MEKYTIENDIRVFCIEADSFPQGIAASWQKLHSLLQGNQQHKYFGISGCNADGKIFYKAAAAEAYPGEAGKMGNNSFIISKGEYQSELIKDYASDVTVIGRTFQQLLKAPDLETDSVCVEIYEGDNDVRCLVKIETIEA